MTRTVLQHFKDLNIPERNQQWRIFPHFVFVYKSYEVPYFGHAPSITALAMACLTFDLPLIQLTLQTVIKILQKVPCITTGRAVCYI